MSNTRPGPSRRAAAWLLRKEGAAAVTIPVSGRVPSVGTAGCGDNTADLTTNISSVTFAPVSATIRAGQSVAWRNGDGVAHTATAPGTFDTGAINAGATSAAIVLSTPGTLQDICSFHPNMVATIVVTP